jgi:hypothetical protein
MLKVEYAVAWLISVELNLVEKKKKIPKTMAEHEHVHVDIMDRLKLTHD